MLVKFISKFNEEKELQVNLEYDILENENLNDNNHFDKNSLSDVHPDNDNAISQRNVSIQSFDAESEIVTNMSEEIPNVTTNAETEFVKNGLFYFLSSSLEGLTVLGKYKMSKILDRRRLKNLIIFNELQKDPLNYK